MGNYQNKIVSSSSALAYSENQSYNQINEINQNFRQRNTSNSNSTCSNGDDSPTQMAINNYGKEFVTAFRTTKLSQICRLETKNLIGNLSPIHDFEMYSTLSSYMLGSPLNGSRIGY